MKRKLILLSLAAATMCMAQPRREIILNEGWLFSRDKAQWENVTVPHDWAIKGPFDKKWDIQTVAIVQNGEKVATEKTGRSGALPWIGEGYYKKALQIPEGYSHAELVFDGAMAEPTVSINGKQAGYWAYGYNAFRIDATPYLTSGNNLLEVGLKNVEESSRWYPGAGLYRPVRLILTGDARFETWRTFAHTTKLTKDTAYVSVESSITGALSDPTTAVEIGIYDQRGSMIDERHIPAKDMALLKTMLYVPKPKLWSPEEPNLYKLVARIYKNNVVVDELKTNIGLRTVSVSKEKGFQLNGKTRKIKGVCLHHDLGPLGAAENKAALIRQIKIMKEMGADAIRTAHNMPSQWQMDVCDSLGMMVMAESFDMWIYPKCKNGYARFFKEWWEQDITNLVLSHRNHPSIIMWSIGNEIPDQGNKEGVEYAKKLQDLCHKLDPSRPVTQGIDRVDAAMKSGFAQVMDVPGFNYRLHKYDKGLKELPQGFLLGSETASTVSSRGVYKFPVEISNWKTYDDGQCNAYDTEYCSWSNLPDDDWVWQDDYQQVIGEFVWTGFDYLGEPTPYDNYWPSRSSYFGICDLAGLAKDRYYLYRSKWNTEKHTVHLLPHWTWPERKGQVTPVYCYTDGVEGELFVNGKSQGRVKKNKDSRLDRYRLRWNNVKYEPGEIKVVAYDENGNKIGEDVRKTAGEPTQLVLDVETMSGKAATLKADGDDMAFVTVSMTDKDGTFCPTADNQLEFEVTGNGTYQAACNGDATSIEVFTEPTMKLFSGKVVVIVRSTKQPGILTLKVTDKKNNITKSVDIKTI